MDSTYSWWRVVSAIERLSDTPFCWFNSGLTRHVSPLLSLHCRLTPSPAAYWLQVLTPSAALFWSCGQRPVRRFAYRGRSMLCVGWWGLTWLGWVVDFNTNASYTTSPACQQSVSLIRMINKRPHTRRTIVLKRTALVKDEQWWQLWQAVTVSGNLGGWPAVWHE